MRATDFAVPFRVMSMPGEPVSELYDVESALSFLLARPKQGGPLYQTALDACFGANVGLVPIVEAERAFLAYARTSGLLSDDMALPVGENRLH